MMKRICTVYLLMLSFCLCAQEKLQPHIPVEVMFGNNRTNFQLSMNKPVIGKLRYNNISIATAPYDIDKEKPELIMINSLIYQFHPNFGVSGGLQYHFLKGFVPNVAFHTSYANPTWLLVLTPYLNLMPERNAETVAMVEFKPRLNEKLRLYTRAMALYNHSLTLNAHDRSFYYFRVGLTLQRFTFGVGANFDYYGPQKVYKDNFGGFLRVAL